MPEMAKHPEQDQEKFRLARVRQLFVTRCRDKATATDVLLFYSWLNQHHPELLPKAKHFDLYRDLEFDLAGLFIPRRWAS